MKLIFSEAIPDPENYVYPYAVWGFLEKGETPATAFQAGFLPSSPNLDRFYLVRQVRVPLQQWKANSENRRILRKVSNLELHRIPRVDFEVTEPRRRSWLVFAECQFGPGVMPAERLDRLLSSPVVNTVLQLVNPTTGQELATALLYTKPPAIAFYYYAFYEQSEENRHLGIGLMTRAVEYFSHAGYRHLHLGTCYTEQSLYKTQFEPVEFFNGFSWSRQLGELKHLIRVPLNKRHRLETSEYLAWQSGGLENIAAASRFRWDSDSGSPGVG